MADAESAVRVIADRCAFDHCQAGGDILPGAPRVIGPLGQSYSESAEWYHPGCWAAHLQEPPFKAGSMVTLSAIGGLVEPAAANADAIAALDATVACACVDRYGLPCQGVAGADGWCSSCRSHANPAPVEVFT